MLRVFGTAASREVLETDLMKICEQIFAEEKKVVVSRCWEAAWGEGAGNAATGFPKHP